LQLFEMTLSAHIADRMHLTLALQELAGAEVGGVSDASAVAE
jgi:hypothetical protein